jgi:RNA polymerase sigma-70 factor, ECF subfamily
MSHQVSDFGARPQLRVLEGGRLESERRSESAGSAESSRLQNLDDAELVILVLNDDFFAFEALYRRHATFAFNLAVRIQGSSSDVEDVVHDAFLRAHARLRDLREPSSFRAWLGSIIVGLVRSRLRQRRLLTLLGLYTGDPVELDAIASPAADPETRVQLAQVYALLQTLPADDRIAWTLRNIEQHGLEVVASLTHCSLATAKRRIARAQKYLEAHFVAPFARDER